MGLRSDGADSRREAGDEGTRRLLAELELRMQEVKSGDETTLTSSSIG